MKNFLELLATDLKLDVAVNGNRYKTGLHTSMTFDVNDLVFVDGIEVLPRYQYLAKDKVLQISQPFYQWHHTASQQGWLLKPQISSNNDGHDDTHQPVAHDWQ
jgi:hypothetical protein